MNATETRRRRPTRGVEQAALTLLRACTRSRNLDTKPKYLHEVYYAEFDLACELMNDLGYGQTRSHVRSIVSEVYNEHGKTAWIELADRLSEIAAKDVRR